MTKKGSTELIFSLDNHFAENGRFVQKNEFFWFGHTFCEQVQKIGIFRSKLCLTYYCYGMMMMILMENCLGQPFCRDPEIKILKPFNTYKKEYVVSKECDSRQVIN